MILPEKYQGISESELKSRIKAVKDKLGTELVILGHHYQRDDVYDFADFTGDSFKLSQDAARQKMAKYIIFCGVHFMAEAARILCSKEQRVFLPDVDAGCPMAEMAALEDVETAWDDISKATDIKKVIPITYMNSSAAIKAFCGRNNGIVCTSSNAGKAFDWALDRGEKIFFLPDEHLGRNTARTKGISHEQIIVWYLANENTKIRKYENTRTREHENTRTRVILWPGFCHVHTYFTVEHVQEARKKYPDGKIIVHPECPEEVVLLCDATGSTEQIKEYVENAPKNSTVIVGTEVNMVGRLAKSNPGKNVVPLARSLCPNMFKISLNDLCWTLEELGNVNEILVDEKIAKDAGTALQRMLDLKQT